MDTALTAIVERSLIDMGMSPARLVSGAGHDAAILARRVPTAMLFLRCKDGISHHPDEYASPKDLAVALRVTIDFLRRLAAQAS